MRLLKSLSLPVRICGFLMLVLSLSRLLLVAWYWDRVAATDGLWFILLQGLRFDLVLMGLLLGPALLTTPWLAGRKFGGGFLRYFFVMVTLFVVFVELGTIPFIDQYDARPNYLYVEYLKYPREVFATLFAAYKLILLGVASASLAAVALVWRLCRQSFPLVSKNPWWQILLLTPLLLVLILMMVRSTLGHRPVNPSTVAFSTDSMVNQLPLNSPYSLLYAIYEQFRDSAGGAANYGRMDDTDVLKIVVEKAGLTDRVDLQSDSPTMHMQWATQQRQKPLNLVIILEESLGAEFVGSLGGKNLTPELDKLAEQGIWFEQLYATGTRSVRGIEAVISGFPPTSKRSVVKLAETQEHFFTLAGFLQTHGYQTSFLYGGEAHFDNMRRFFLNNGFQVVIDENDYQSPRFTGSWGVSDEDLFQRADEYFLAQGQQPFFSLVFTSSNHEPFEIPAGKVEQQPGPDGGRDTAVKYADYALGWFFEQARSSDYFKNTVFLVVSDHNSRVYGDQLVPIERFHIPGVILGGEIKPRCISGISSQVDLLPTLLSLMGINGHHPAIGFDLTRAEFKHGAGRAQMQFNDIQAWMEPGKVVVLQRNLPMQSFLYNTGGRLAPDPEPDSIMMQRALAHALWPPMTIRNRAYRSK